MSTLLLEVRDLSCGYDSRFVLRGINFRVGKGELCGIIGPNGSGKTTLLRAITKVIKPQRGRIFFGGEDVGRMGLKELAREIAVVSQTQDYGTDMTVEEFVLLGRIPYRRGFQFFDTRYDVEIARNAMELTGIVGLKDRFIIELSGGERQLAVIARALTQEPKLLLLDEATAHLDISHQVRILDLIRRLNRENGLTVMMVLHDLNSASEYCERLILLSNGSIHRMGTCREVLTYRTIEEVYDTVVVVEENPISKKPYVLIVAGELKSNKRIMK